MVKFEIGRKYGSGRYRYKVVGRSADNDTVDLLYNDEEKSETYGIVVDGDVEICLIEGRKKPLKASSVLGAPRRWSVEESKTRRNRQHNAHAKKKYERLEIAVPKGMLKRIDDAVEKLEFDSRRQYVISVIEDQLKKIKI